MKTTSGLKSERRSARQMAWTFFCFLAWGAILLAPGAYAAPCSVKPPVELTVTADETALAGGGQAGVTLSAVPDGDVPQAEAVFAVTSGDILITGPVRVDLGALRAGETCFAETGIRLTGKGKSEVRAWLNAYDENGTPLWARSRALYVLSSEGDILTGQSSPYELDIRHLENARAAKKLTDEAYEARLNQVRGGGAIESKSVSQGMAKAGTITVNGTILWTDNVGNTHPSRYVDIEIRDENIAGSELAATVQTYYDGTFSATVENSDTFGLNGRDIFIRVIANSVYTRVHPPGSGDAHFLQSSTTNDVTDGSTVTINLTANNTDDNNRAFSVLDAYTTISPYGSFFTVVPKIEVDFPTTASTSNYDGTDLSILRDDWIDWDVIHHEFGHYFMDMANIENNPGGSHNLDENLGERVGKDAGIRLAWGEGFPTYFGTAGQQYGYASSLNVPNVGDFFYTDTIDATINYGLEPAAGSLGEDNELSVQRILWDLYDTGTDARDNVALFDYGVFLPASSAGAVNLSQFWNGLIAGLPMETTVACGCIFADHKVAPEPTDPPNGATVGGGTPPTFKWEANGGGPTKRNNKFKVQFYDENFSSLIFESGELDTTSYTPSTADWNTILAGAELIKWVVQGKNDAAPETGWYVSCSRTLNGADIAFVIDDTGSMAEEIGGVRDALIQFIAGLEASEEEALILVVTFKDGVSTRIASSDLDAVLAVVSSLTADGGGDCPEASVEALNVVAQTIAPGGRILFATDADPHAGLDIPSTIATLRAQGLSVDVLLSGSCSETYKSGTNFSLDSAMGEMYALGSSCNFPDCPESAGAAKTPPGCSGPDCNEPVPPPADFPQGAIAVFSAIAAETGGIFAFVPNVNMGDPVPYNNAALNIMLGAINPSIPNVNPATGNAGTTINIVLTGSNTNFNASSELSFGGTGIAVNSSVAASATTLAANITIAEDAPQGFRDVTVTTDLGSTTETATGVGAFEVEGIPANVVITSVSPAAGALGQTLDVTITGYGTQFDGSSTAGFGDGIVVNSFTPASATEGVANISIEDDNAVLGYHDVIVNTTAGAVYENVIGPFLVTTSSFGAFIPRVVSVTPAAGAPGATLNVTIVGENTSFENGESAAAFSGAGITVNSISVTSQTEATVNITIGAAAEPGYRDVSITTGDEVAVLLNGFLVSEVANQPPVADAGGDQTVVATSDTALVTLDGSGSSDPDGTIAAYSWTGAPDPDDVVNPALNLAPGEYTFSLVVTDNEGALSTADSVTVTVERKRPLFYGAAGPDRGGSFAADALVIAAVVLLLQMSAAHVRRTVKKCG